MLWKLLLFPSYLPTKLRDPRNSDINSSIWNPKSFAPSLRLYISSPTPLPLGTRDRINWFIIMHKHDRVCIYTLLTLLYDQDKQGCYPIYICISFQIGWLTFHSCMNSVICSRVAFLCLLNSSFKYWSPKALEVTGRFLCRFRIRR